MGRPNLVFASIVALYALYSVLFIVSSSFVIDGQRYFCLLDDQMISMRFAAHLAAGEGLTWNPGEYVEGFSNPLWTFYMAFWHWLGLQAARTSLAIQVTGAALSIATLWCVRRLSGELSLRWEVTAMAMLLVALYYPLNYWVLLGTEVGVLAFVVTAATLMSLRLVRGFGGGLVLLYVLLALSLWVRLDAAVPAGVLLCWNAWKDTKRRRLHLILGGGLLAFSLGAQTLWRLWYFGDLLPNTYYLKMTGVPLAIRAPRGAVALLALVIFSSPVLLGAFSASLVRQADERYRLLAGLCGAQVLYSIYVGGDVWEWQFGANRFLSITAPLWLILLSLGLWRSVSFFAQTSSALAVAGGTALGLLIATAVTPPSLGIPLPSTLPAPILPLAGVALGLIIGVYLARRRARLDPARATQQVRLLFVLAGLAALINLNSHLRVAPGQSSSDFWIALAPPPSSAELAMLLRLSRFVEEMTTDEASLSVTWAGALPYFTDRRTLDFLGKSDPVVARLPPRLTSILEYIPGHNKWSYEHTVGTGSPDVVVQVWPSPVLLPADEELPAEARPYLTGKYLAVPFEDRQIWVRKDSRRIRWEVIDPVAALQPVE